MHMWPPYAIIIFEVTNIQLCRTSNSKKRWKDSLNLLIWSSTAAPTCHVSLFLSPKICFKEHRWISQNSRKKAELKVKPTLQTHFNIIKTESCCPIFQLKQHLTDLVMFYQGTPQKSSIGSAVFLLDTHYGFLLLALTRSWQTSLCSSYSIWLAQGRACVTQNHKMTQIMEYLWNMNL